MRNRPIGDAAEPRREPAISGKAGMPVRPGALLVFEPNLPAWGNDLVSRAWRRRSFSPLDEFRRATRGQFHRWFLRSLILEQSQKERSVPSHALVGIIHPSRQQRKDGFVLGVPGPRRPGIGDCKNAEARARSQIFDSVSILHLRIEAFWIERKMIRQRLGALRNGQSEAKGKHTGQTRRRPR